MDSEAISATAAKNLILAFGRMMDQAYRVDPSEEFFIVSTWDRAERLVPMLLARLAPKDRPNVIRDLFGHGQSLGWLTSIFRHEIFSHGIWGNQAKPQAAWRLSEADFAEARNLMLSRYRLMSLAEVLAIPRPIHALFAWNQGGNEEEPRALVTDGTATDEELICVLEKMTGFIDSSDRGRYEVLKRSSLEPFLDYDSASERLTATAASSSALKGRASRLLAALNSATDY